MTTHSPADLEAAESLPQMIHIDIYRDAKNEIETLHLLLDAKTHIIECRDLKITELKARMRLTDYESCVVSDCRRSFLSPRELQLFAIIDRITSAGGVG